MRALPTVRLLYVLALSLPALAPPRARAEAPPPPPALPAAEVLPALVDGQAAFGCDLFRALAGAGPNVLLSPASVHAALAMTRAGARGETAAQMDRVLRLPPQGTAEAWRALTAALASPAPARSARGAEGPAYSLSVANSLWGRRGYPFVQAFRESLASAYGARLEEVDFAQGPGTRRRINDWVATQTRDRIRDLIPEGLPTPDTRLALVNAIHFLAPWEEPFEERATIDAPFTTTEGRRQDVKMMRRTDTWAYLDDGAVQALVVPYRDRAVELLLVLPRQADGLGEVERGLSAQGLRRWATGGAPTKVALSLPRFRFEGAFELSRALAALGMPAPFSAATADLKGIADVPGEPLYVGAVLHKTFIAVDEKGTEAAAATAVLLRAGSAARPAEPVPFVCDRPFLFALRHRATGALLFLGRVGAP